MRGCKGAIIMEAANQAIAEIYAQYAPRVRDYVLGRTHDEQLAEDLCADVFAKACAKISTYDESKASLSTWLFAITRNTLADHYRYHRVCAELPVALESPESIEEDFCTNETLEALACALETLDARSRDIIISHYYEGHTLRRIATSLGISYSYVKVLHKDALRNLNRELRKLQD